jgi:hypothetical protein
MAESYKVDDITKKIKALKDTATELKRLSEGIPAVERNVDRILASIKMLEINVSDLDGIV